MSKTIWIIKDDLLAFQDGQVAAQSGLPREVIKRYKTYNERAAFNDGWDSVMRFEVSFGRGKRMPRSE